MAMLWSAPSDDTTVERDSMVRSTIVDHLMTISKMTGAIDTIPDSEVLRARLVLSLRELGIPQDFLSRLSGNVEQDTAMIQALDVTPVVTFALLRAVRKLIDQKKLETAQELIRPFVEQSPEHAEAHYLLARAESGLWNLETAEALYQRAIELDPGRVETYSGLAALYERTARYEAADTTWRRAFQFGAISKRQYIGSDPRPIRLLIITSVLAGNIRFMRFLDTREFDITVIVAESYTPELFLPEHDVVVQAIGDTELCMRGIRIARQIVARSQAPVINDPALVMLTGREDNAARLARIDNVATPLTKTFDRTELIDDEAERRLFDAGFVYPILLRSPGFFNGRFFEKSVCREDLTRIVDSLPGERLIAIEYIDTMLPDGTIRKYRMMGIGKKLYPIHLAISYHWKIHYFSANMGDAQSFRDEERAYLENPLAVLGENAMQALAEIVSVLGLDYCGIDFTINSAGKVLVFEANATMALLLPDSSAQWEYRRAPIAAAISAARDVVHVSGLQRIDSLAVVE